MDLFEGIYFQGYIYFRVVGKEGSKGRFFEEVKYQDFVFKVKEEKSLKNINRNLFFNVVC